MKKGLLRKIPPSKEKAIQSIRKAKELLEEARYDLEDERYNSATVVGYLALFNSARALLFRDGYRERSHACIARYLENKYKSKIPQDMIDLLDSYRSSRHHVQYDTSYLATKRESANIIQFTKEFIE